MKVSINRINTKLCFISSLSFNATNIFILCIDISLKKTKDIKAFKILKKKLS